jgi:hypothetical protein
VRKFIAMHSSELGFDAPSEVIQWIGSQNSPVDWRVVEIYIDEFTAFHTDNERHAELEAQYIRGMEMARKLLRLHLGLGVPGDSQ